MFELAADNGRIEAAALLEQAGAECNYANDMLNESYVRCPFCYHRITSDIDDPTCEHLVSLFYIDDICDYYSSSDEIDNPDIDEEEVVEDNNPEDDPRGRYIQPENTRIVTEAYPVGRRVKRLDIAEAGRLLEQAPTEIKPLLEQARKVEKDGLAGPEAEVCLRFDINNMWGDWYYLYFRPGPALTENQAAALSEWLDRQNIPA